MPLETLMTLDDELGRAMTPQELAKRLRVSVNTVRKYRDRWGGVEVALGKIRFFENKVREVIHASADNEVQSAAMAGCRHIQREAKRKVVPGRVREKQAGSGKVGGKAAPHHEETDPDRHGLAEAD